jgi:hypothetical protein
VSKKKTAFKSFPACPRRVPVQPTCAKAALNESIKSRARAGDINRLCGSRAVFIKTLLFIFENYARP